MSQNQRRSSGRDASGRDSGRRDNAPRRDGPKRNKKGRNKKRLFNIVTIEFRTSFLKHDYDARDHALAPGQDVVVETGRGPLVGRVVSPISRQYRSPEGVRRVLRRATASDLAQVERNEERERGAYLFALDRIRTRRLPMKLIRAQYMHDGSKIVFYFSADGRIDFRDLVKDLAHRFRTRIEMYQIGVRDGARMLGGIGPCGRELCCSTFLENFAPVSIRMAKDQGLTLNPKKVSGMCGRLMCCLVYEQQLYKRMRRRLPRVNSDVFTEHGPARVLSVDVINERVTVMLEDTNRVTLPAREISDVPLVEPELPEEEPTFLWDGVEPATETRRERRRRQRDGDDKPEEASAEGGGRRRRRRRRRKTEGGGGEDSGSASNAGAQAPSGGEGTPAAEGESKPKRRRRRRGGRGRGGKKKNEGGGGGDGGGSKSSE